MDQTLADADRHVAELESRGYVQVEDHNGFRSGARIKHAGQRFGYREGTATVHAVLIKDRSPWAQKYGRPDVEMVVIRDRALLEGMSPVTDWADYHGELAQP